MLEVRRAQNIVIALVQYRKFGEHAEFLRAICNLDTMGGMLTSDHVHNLKALLPTEAELKHIRTISCSLHPAEQFVQTCMLFYPALPHHVATLHDCLDFCGRCEHAEKIARKLIAACNKVLASSKLSKLLKKILAIGNVMNSGTSKGRASGFTLDSLSKMILTKAAGDKSMSLLDYVVKSLHDKQESGSLGIVEDFSLLYESSKLSGECYVSVRVYTAYHKLLLEYH